MTLPKSPRNLPETEHGEWLFKARRNRRMSRRKLAEISGWSASMITAVERGTRKLTHQMYRDVKEAMDAHGQNARR